MTGLPEILLNFPNTCHYIFYKIKKIYEENLRRKSRPISLKFENNM